MGISKRATEIARSCLHVQSISCWAPACIGPYSQAYTLGGIVHLAGQIGLDPATMSLVEREKESQERNANTEEEEREKEKEDVGGGSEAEERVRAQTKEILRHIERVLAVVQSRPDYILSLTCFLLDMKFSRLVLGLLQQKWRSLSSRLASPNHQSTNIEPREEDEVEADDEDTQEASEPQWCPLVRFVEVPALPKGASVEIQVTTPPSNLVRMWLIGRITGCVSQSDFTTQFLQDSKHRQRSSFLAQASTLHGSSRH